MINAQRNNGPRADRVGRNRRSASSARLGTVNMGFGKVIADIFGKAPKKPVVTSDTRDVFADKSSTVLAGTASASPITQASTDHYEETLGLDELDKVTAGGGSIVEDALI